MQVGGRHYRSIWIEDDSNRTCIIDQTLLPHRFETRVLATLEDAAEAIETMRVRGAPLIGATAAHGVALAMERDASDGSLESCLRRLESTRPTAVNLRWALERMECVLSRLDPSDRATRARAEALDICDEDVRCCMAIADNGYAILAERAAELGRSEDAPLQILTHCNAGWLATVDWGTALAPIYKAQEAGLPVHVWVDETRPRNQGASLTAFELREQGIPHSVVVDNAGGHLMQTGKVDVVLVGSDRTTADGDVCNKIGTYLKALAARDNGIPFYVMLPTSTIDWQMHDGLKEIPIESRAPEEVRRVTGLDSRGELCSVDLFPETTPAANPAFDVTPADLVTGLVTERGVFSANRDSLSALRKTLEETNPS